MLDKAAALGSSKTLYDSNREVHSLLRYGVKVKPEVGEQTVVARGCSRADPVCSCVCLWT